jgi:hypothetical protein
MKYYPIITEKDGNAVICTHVGTGRKAVFYGFTIFQARQLFKKSIKDEKKSAFSFTRT